MFLSTLLVYILCYCETGGRIIMACVGLILLPFYFRYYITFNSDSVDEGLLSRIILSSSLTGQRRYGHYVLTPVETHTFTTLETSPHLSAWVQSRFLSTLFFFSPPWSVIHTVFTFYSYNNTARGGMPETQIISFFIVTLWSFIQMCNFWMKT